MGYNYRLDEMSAALGRVQLSRIEELLDKREQVAGGTATDRRNPVSQFPGSLNDHTLELVRLRGCASMQT